MMASVSVMSNLNSESWFAANWTSVWFYQEGWMNITFFLSFMTAAFLWRPTEHNARYGLEELPDSADAANELEMEQAVTSMTEQAHEETHEYNVDGSGMQQQ